MTWLVATFKGQPVADSRKINHLRELDSSEPDPCAPKLSESGLRTVAYNARSLVKKALDLASPQSEFRNFVLGRTI